MKELTKLAKNIKKYRKKLNISQDKLAKLSGLAYNTIAKIEPNLCVSKVCLKSTFYWVQHCLC